MPLSEGFLIALFCLAVVFAVLGILWIIIRVFSTILNNIGRTNEKTLSDGQHRI